MTSKRFRRLIALTAVGLAAGATGLVWTGLPACSYPPPETPEPCDKQIVTLDIYAAENINPSEQGARPRPVVVRLYQLANDMRMVDAKYEAILFKDAETLGEDLMQVNEVEVYPNDLVRVKFERIPEATMLAGVALFRDPQGHSWKTYYEFPPMPNAPAACGALGGEDAGEPQVAPKTAFFIREVKIDNGSQFDPSMFSQSTPLRKINLPKRSAAPDQYAAADQPSGKSGP